MHTKQKFKIAAFGILMGISGQSFSAIVSSFHDGSFVDTSNESNKIVAAAISKGNTVTKFTGTNWSSQLASSNAILIPELERGNLSANLSSSTKYDISNFVNNGGNLVLSADYTSNDVSFLNDIFGFSLLNKGFQRVTTSYLGDADFNIGVSSLAWLDGTYFLDTVSILASGGRSVFGSSFGSTVATWDYGLGNITYLGYDYYGAYNDSAWNSVLDTALNLSNNSSAVPEPSILALMGLGIFGLGLSRRKKK